MVVVFHHGWALDAGLWDAVVARMPDFECRLADRGYFGAKRAAAIDGPHVMVAHSFGTMLGLSHLSPDCRGLVAINGFDRFCADGDFPGVSPRVLDRMLARFAEDPAGVVDDFRRRCGCDAPVANLDAGRLGADLARLRGDDCRGMAGELPILSLQGGIDPILPAAMRDAVFAEACCIERRLHPNAGHLLPLSDPDYCASAIAQFAGGLA